MIKFIRARHNDETGVVLIIVACAMVVLIGMLAIAIDASYGFVQNRRAQNAADFSAFAAARLLENSTYCEGTNQPTMAQLVGVVQNLVQSNDPSLGTAWSGQFLDRSGHGLIDPATGQDYTFSPTSGATLPPEGACGVNITATPSWPPFFSGIFNVHKLGGFATGSVGPTASTGTPISIVALNKVGPHEILGGGSGQFVVSGDIVLNTNVQEQPWSASANGYEYDDAIDAKNGSSLYMYGTIHSIGSETINNMLTTLWPLDTCFDTLGIAGAGDNESPAYQTGDPTLQAPANQLSCHNGAVNVDYDSIDATATQIDDPLASASNPPPNPLSASTNITCPGQPANVVTSVPAGGFTSLQPGDYQIPVEITGSAVFNDCPGGYTGLYRFEQGLWINPQAVGDSVTGTNVVIGTENPYPMAGNVPGSIDATTGAFDANGAGNGAPCLPSTTMTSAASGNGAPMAETSANQCGGTTDDGVIGYFDNATTTPDTSETGTGNNFSAIIGGAAGSSVTLTGPTNGIYAGDNGQPGLVIYQDPTVQANTGFDAEAGDAADIQINGVVYNNSLSHYGADAPEDFWDGTGGGIPFYAGGTLQAGYGTGWSGGPTPSGGNVTLNGTAIVDDFNTDGGTDIDIIGQPYTLAGAGPLSLIG